MKLANVKKLYFDGKIDKARYIEKMFGMHKCLFDYSEFVVNTDIKRIEITDFSVIMETREGIKILCDPKDKRLAPLEILNFNAYEKAERQMMFSLVDKGCIFFDVGANFGWYSLNLCNKFKDIKVFAFEPVKETFEHLLFNIKLNKVINIKSFNFGFWNEEGTYPLYFRPDESVSASMADLKGDKRTKKLICKMVRLDNFVKAKKTHVDFIKCDVEGAELFVLKGAKNTLLRYKPIIFCEMLRKWSAKFGYHPNEIIRLLKSIGYGCFTAKGGSLKQFVKMTDSTLETNFFFLHTNKHRSKIAKFVQ